MARRRREVKDIGRQHGKFDLDRVGFFVDPSPAPFDPYVGVPVRFREGIEKGRQMHPGPSSKLFEVEFKRIFDGEALYEPWSIEAKERLQQKGAMIGTRTMMPPSPAKKHSTPGDWHGCFEKVSYFSPAVIELKQEKGLPPNPSIKPNPKGGPGYTDICLSPFPTYYSDPYDPPREPPESLGKFLSACAPLDHFPPNPYEDKDPGPTYVRPQVTVPPIRGPGKIYVPFPKKPGGNHSGCFDKFPEYASDPYDKDKVPKKRLGAIVSGGPAQKAKYTSSIINQVTRVSCNSANYKTYVPQVYPLNK